MTAARNSRSASARSPRAATWLAWASISLTWVCVSRLMGIVQGIALFQADVDHAQHWHADQRAGWQVTERGYTLIETLIVKQATTRHLQRSARQ